jgi:hypothetical protein
MIQMTSNDKELVRFRRERNMVAKNNKHKGGYHTPAKFDRKRKQVTEYGSMTQEEINEYWEFNV